MRVVGSDFLFCAPAKRLTALCLCLCLCLASVVHLQRRGGSRVALLRWRGLKCQMVTEVSVETRVTMG